MKLSSLYEDSDVRPFRFAVIVGAIVIAILVSSSSKGQEVNSRVNWMTSYQEALNAASDQNAPMMLFFSGSDWCPWCKKLSQEVFETAEFVAWADARLIPVMLDFPRNQPLPQSLSNQNNTLLSRYRPHLTGFPTALFVKPDGAVIGKMGYEPKGVKVWIHKAQKIVGKLDKVAVVDGRLTR